MNKLIPKFQNPSVDKTFDVLSAIPDDAVN